MKIGVVGLGYVGLPLAVAFAEVGNEIVGLDLDVSKLDRLRQNSSYIEDISDETVAAIADKSTWTSQYSDLAVCDAVIIAVPTPLTPNREPDLGPLVASASSLASVLRGDQLVVLESTTYPGTTRERLIPLLEESGLKAGTDFFVAFSPERVDPGNKKFTLQTTPKVVGGEGEEASRRAVALYEQICAEIVEVSTPEAAEMTKLLENTFRAVNIAFVNEIAIICDGLGIDTWEVVDAAATKPFGFMSFQPGPGLGGHCLPIDPFYLSWKAREYGLSAEFIELAGRMNQNMPLFCVQKAIDSLNKLGLAVSQAKIGVLGVSYKSDVGDLRESPALRIIEDLIERGGSIRYHDQHVAELPRLGLTCDSLDDVISQSDLVMIVTTHSGVDYQDVVTRSRSVLDFRGVTRGMRAENLARL